MSDLVSGQFIINEAYKRADCEGATERHPRTDVLAYANAGAAELYDLLVEFRGRSYYRKPTPHSITTTADTTRYALPSDFYRLISVRRSGDYADNLQPFTQQDEPLLRMEGAAVDFPTHYELQNGYIALLPEHDAGETVIVEYIPPVTPLVDTSTEVFDAINGWESYIIYYAARCMAEKDDEPNVVRYCNNQIDRLRQRISKLAPMRDAFRAERVKDVRGHMPWGWRR
jgi:hypothetical protein